MGNNTSSPSPPSQQPHKLPDQSNALSRKLINDVIVNKRSAPRITKLELRGELIPSSSRDRSNLELNLDESYTKQRQRSVVSSSQGSDQMTNESIVSSTSSVSSISSPSMVDADDANVFQHIDEIDKDIEFEHIEGIGLSGGDTMQLQDTDEKIPVVIKWYCTGNEREVYIIGDFTNWKKKLKLHKVDNQFKLKLSLPKGLYKIQFLINTREVKISNHLPIATDNEGNIVNWFEVYDTKESPKLHSYSTPVLDSQKITPLEAGSMENKRIEKRTISVDHLQRPPILSPASDIYSGRTTPDLERQGLSPSPLAKGFPYNTNQRHISNQSTISGVSTTNDSSSVNSVSTYHYRTPAKPQYDYSNELPEIYYRENLSYPYPDLTNSVDFYNNINFEDYLQNKLQISPPPELPLHLSSLLINDDGNHKSKNNKLNDLNVDKYSGVNYSGLDNIPNHVILKHLITTNIKNNVMMVTVINRYEGKYVYQALYSPVDDIFE